MSYSIEQIAAKWDAVTMGCREAVRERCSWALEAEASFLNSLSESDRNGYGDYLKWSFPAIRRAVDSLEIKQMSVAEEVYRAVVEAVESISQTRESLDPTDTTDPVERKAFAQDVTSRLFPALQSFPG